MGRPEEYTVAQMIEALEATKGKVYLAAELIGCPHATVYNYAKRHPEVQDVRDRWDGRMLDTAENELMKLVEAGELPAIKFALATKGKARGYVERTEHTGADGRDLIYRAEIVKGRIETETTDTTGEADAP